MIPAYVPIENEGMSIISALFFAFGGAAFFMFGGWVVKRLDKHDDSIQDTNIKITRIEGSIETTKVIVQRIDDSMSEIGKQNIYLTKYILNNTKGVKQDAD